MDIKTPNEFPGEEILVNNSTFSASIETLPFKISYMLQYNHCVLYLFLCPIFMLPLDNPNILPEEAPLTSSNPRRAPFFILPGNYQTLPVYLVHKGVAHYGFQILYQGKNPLRINIKLTVKPKTPSGNLARLELAQLLVFKHDGKMDPHVIKTIVIMHPPNVHSVRNFRDRRPNLVSPLPYIQSPVPYRYRLNLFAENRYRQLVSFGDLETIYFGKYRSGWDEAYSIPLWTFDLPPRLPPNVINFLIRQYIAGDAFVFTKNLLSYILKTEPHAITLQNQSTQTEQADTTEVGLQTDSFPGEEAELDSILADLMSLENDTFNAPALSPVQVKPLSVTNYK